MEFYFARKSASSTVQRIPSTPASHGVVQRKAIGGILRGSASGPRLQARLTVSDPHDVYEQEADQVADSVMRTPESSTNTTIQLEGEETIQRMCTECEEEVQRMPLEEDDFELQAKAADSTSAGSFEPDTAALTGLQGGGKALSSETQSYFGERMGYDFGNVRVHTDSRADHLARSVQARAFTYGNNVVFRSGEFSQDTSAGKHLLAHELTHTIQQGAVTPVQESEDP